MTVYTCERCGADAGEAGVFCVPCRVALYDSLLRSAIWRKIAAGRRGDMAGESLLATIARERAALCSGGGVEGARARLAGGGS